MTKNKKSALSSRQKLFCLMSAVAMLITFRYSDIAIASMSQGMKLCVSTVIPSLFPFMVLSELIVSSGASEFMGRYLAYPFGKLFNVSRDGAAVFLLGLLCGFPVATKSAVSLYKRGRISKGELEHLCSFCNSPSSAFLISAVGSGLFGSRSFGVLLYAAHIISSVILGLCGRAWFDKKKKDAEYFTSPTLSSYRKKGGVEAFSNAVTGSAESMLYICAFIVFFSAAVGLLRFFAESLALPDIFVALCFGFFEMTGGVSAAAELPRALALPVVALITGWSGLSVHFQFVGVCNLKDDGFSLRPYLLSKLFCALLNFITVIIFTRFFGHLIVFGEQGSAASLLLVPVAPLNLIPLAVFFTGCAVRLAKIDRGGE